MVTAIVVVAPVIVVVVLVVAAAAAFAAAAAATAKLIGFLLKAPALPGLALFRFCLTAKPSSSPCLALFWGHGPGGRGRGEEEEKGRPWNSKGPPEHPSCPLPGRRSVGYLGAGPRWLVGSTPAYRLSAVSRLISLAFAFRVFNLLGPLGVT